MQGRRVSLLLGVPIVLVCGGLGLALGMNVPPHGLESSVERAGVESGKQAVAVAAVPSAEAPLPETGPSGHLVVSPVLETKDDQTVMAPQPAIGPAAPKIEKIDSGEGQRKVRRPREAGKRGVVSHNPNARRERHGQKTGAEPSERSRPVISQIPIVGPVFGLFLQ